jgi:hypothetical protein
MQNLATILDTLGDYQMAEHHLTEALMIEEKELGEENIEIAVTMNNLGVLLAHNSQFPKAKVRLFVPAYHCFYSLFLYVLLCRFPSFRCFSFPLLISLSSLLNGSVC